MLPAKSNWSIHEVEEREVEQLTEQTGLHPLVAKLLLIRGLKQPEEALEFLQSKTDRLHSPFLMDGMQAAVDRIKAAIQNNEFIRIYGDYDADGVSSTAIMVRVLRKLGASFDYYIPHRMKEGYGLNIQAIDEAKASGVSLIVTVDNGISSRDEISHAHSLGIDVVVTDHHEPPELLPEHAAACINPRQPDCTYPFKGLAGAGVAWKLAYALCGEKIDELTELATVGTIADLMPMTEENRIIVTEGLKLMQSTRIVGLKAIFERAGLTGQTVDETHIGFVVGPRINAAGRLDSAEVAVKLLITDDLDEADQLAEQLDQLNKKRQTIVDKLTKEAMELAETKYSNDRVIVLAGENWHAGVVGIVASRLLDRWYRPVVVLDIDPETRMAKGSARSIDGFDIHRALTFCDDLLEHYGGHQAAGGMSLKEEHIESFRLRLNELADEWLEPSDFVPKSAADLVCSLDDISIDTINEIAKLAPFGIGNPSPRFVFKNMKIDKLDRLGKTKKHLKMLLKPADDRAEPKRVEALAFGLADLDGWISPWANIHLYGELSINEWNGRRTPQIRVSEMSIAERQVFDWRGVKNGAAEWEKWQQARKLSGHHDALPVVLGNAASKHLESIGMEIACYTYEQLENSGADDQEPIIRRATDVILYSLPQDVDQLKSVLRRFTNVERLIVWLCEEELFSQTLPTRDHFKRVYLLLKQHNEMDLKNEANVQMLQRQTGLTTKMIRFIIGVFHELEFIKINGSVVEIHPSPSKRDLQTSAIYQKQQQKQEMEQFLLQSSGSELAKWLLKQLPDTTFDSENERQTNAFAI